MDKIKRLQIVELNLQDFEIDESLNIQRAFVLIDIVNGKSKTSTELNLGLDLVGIVCQNDNNEFKLSLSDDYQGSFSEEEFKQIVMENITKLTNYVEAGVNTIKESINTIKELDQSLVNLTKILDNN